ncbi:MAG TPA: hypothetical protein VFQ35_19500 [Polyangiaceae bacterium]|nr:hypothetical protein [Polyangiaceae bacterium]
MLPRRQPSGHHMLVWLLALVVIAVVLVLASALLRALLKKHGIM